MPRRVGSLARDDRGSVAVEFALTVPLLLLVLFSTLMFGLYCATLNGLEQLAAGAARRTIAGLDDGERSALAGQYVASYGPSYPYLRQANLRVQVANDAVARTTKVSITYDVASAPPFTVAASLVPALPRTLTRSAVVPQGGQ